VRHYEVVDEDAAAYTGHSEVLSKSV
jgi:hypothetical protein